MSYLERLRTVEHEKTGTLATDKTDKSPSVSFVSSLGAPFPRGDDCDADLSEARSNQHSSQRLCSVCGQPARFGYGVRLLHGEGAEHLKQRFLAAGGNPDTFKYQQRKGVSGDGIPYVVEFAFGLHQSGLAQSGARVSRKFVTGANFSAAIGNPFRRFGSTGEGLDSTLAKVRADPTAPVICEIHSRPERTSDDPANPTREGDAMTRRPYTPQAAAIRVTYGSSCKATQLFGMENAPWVLARIILAEQVREALGHNEGED